MEERGGATAQPQLVASGANRSRKDRVKFVSWCVTESVVDKRFVLATVLI